MGRSRLPPAPAMNSPISRMRSTGELISRAISASMAASSPPIMRETRSFRSVSRAVGGLTPERAGAVTGERPDP